MPGPKVRNLARTEPELVPKNRAVSDFARALPIASDQRTRSDREGPSDACRASE